MRLNAAKSLDGARPTRAVARHLASTSGRLIPVQFALIYDGKGLDGVSLNSILGRMISISVPPSV